MGQFFDHITASSTPQESQAIFLKLREAILIIFPYLGLPTCMPACYGMIGVAQRKGKEFANLKVLRKKTIDEEDVRKGQELRKKIYAGVGNSEIMDLLKVYFEDLREFTTAP